MAQFPSPRSLLLLTAAAWCLAAAPVCLQAQPSGGPYGPVRENYAVPQGAAHVFYVAPDGQAEAAGTELAAPTSLASALARAVTGDAIVLRGGVYRTGDLKLNQGITLQPYADEQPVLKGTEVATQWEEQKNGLWRAAWSHLFPAKAQSWWRRSSEGRKTPPWRFNNDMVFVDGELLKAVGWEGEIDAHSYYIDYEAGQVYLGVDPKDHVVEITAHDSAIIRTTGELNGRKSDGKGPTIRGLTFTQYAYRALEIEGAEPEAAMPETQFGKDVVGTTLENDTITFCSRVAGYFRGDRLVMRHCLISDTRTEGVYVIASNDVLLEKNIFRRNNIQEITGYYPSAVKIFNQSHRVTCRDNLVIDNPHSNGIWYDVGEVDGVFVDNWVQGCIDGFFFEISKGVTVTGNVFVDCDKGMRILNSSNAHAYHNTFVNTVASFERTERSAVGDHFGWHPTTGPGVNQREGHIFANNLLVADASFPKALLRVEQTKVLCGQLTRPAMTALAHNVFVRSPVAAPTPLLVWGPVDGPDCVAELKTPEELHALNAAFPTGKLLLRDIGSVFHGPALERFELLADFATEAAVPAAPEEIRALLNWRANAGFVAGAYQVSPRK